MAYSYGTQGAPAVGGGAPGLPSRKQADQSTYTRIVSGSGVLIPPQGAKMMRVACIGGGGGGNVSATTANVGWAGGGGGCAASKIVPAVPISYSIGAAGTYNVNGGDTIADFSGYHLVGGGGKSGSNSPNGGVGSGGDYNFNGGEGAVNNTNRGAVSANLCGGGAAGPNGNGGNGGGSDNSPATFITATDGQYSGTGWGSGGGGGGVPVGDTTLCALGGGGTGARGGYFKSVNTPPKNPSQSPWGLNGVDSVTPASESYTTTGGEMGGGGSVVSNAQTPPIWRAKNGGSGGMVVEWFY